MEITKKIVEHLAHLSRLNFTESELENFKQEFEKTMKHVDELEKVDTTSLVEHNLCLDAKNELRQDEVVESISKEEALAEAPQKAQGMFRLLKMVE